MENTNNRETVSPIEEQEKKKIDRFNVWALLFPYIWSLIKGLHLYAFITIALALGANLSHMFRVGWLATIFVILLFAWRLYLGFLGNREVWDRKNETDPKTIEKRKCREGFALLGAIIGGMAYLVIVASVFSEAMRISDVQYYDNYQDNYYSNYYDDWDTIAVTEENADSGYNENTYEIK